MKTHSTLLLFLFLSFVSTSTAFAQNDDHLVVYKNGTMKDVIKASEISSVDFVKQPYLREEGYGDTIRFTASAGRSYNFGIVRSNFPWTVTTDADWVVARVLPDSIKALSGYSDYDNRFLVYSAINDSDSPRTAKLTIRSEAGYIIEKTIYQEPYILSFTMTGVETREAETEKEYYIAWDDSLFYEDFLPNFGWEIESYPSWLTIVSATPSAPNNSFEKYEEKRFWGYSPWQSIGFRGSWNTRLDTRSGNVVIQGHGQTIVDHITQEGFGSSIDKLADDFMQGYFVYGEQYDETDMAYPAYMIAATELLGDMYPEGSNSGYDWYKGFNTGDAMGEKNLHTYVLWHTYYNYIDKTNNIIQAAKLSSDESLNTIAGLAYVFRALSYYLLTVLYEPVENIYTDCTDVLGLTVPIVTGEMTKEQKSANPRAPHDDMIAFILSDLDAAEKYLANHTPASKYHPTLAAVYGLKARVYMWDAGMANKGYGRKESYAKAAEYARKAIDVSGCTPLTQDQWLDVNNGFNNIDSNNAWIWGLHYKPEKMGNLCNFTGWMSHEADWGYASLTCPSIDKNLYDRISYNDFRKFTFLDPDRSVFNYQTCRDQAFLDNCNDYLSLKFRCLNGDWENYNVGGAVDVPVMRIEEMYLIEAEAIGMYKDVTDGIEALNHFMQTYRDSSYNFYNKSSFSSRDFQLEIMWQKRIEFWGEGVSFPDAKRIRPGVMQWYEGSNAPAEIFHINAQGIKPWWTLAIPRRALDENASLVNNPDPSGTFKSYYVNPGEYWIP